MAQFVLKEYGNAPAVPTAVLMEVLRQELQVGGRAGGLNARFCVLCIACAHTRCAHLTVVLKHSTPGFVEVFPGFAVQFSGSHS